MKSGIFFPKHNWYLIFLFLLLCTYSSNTFAQIPSNSLGLHRNNIKWLQIKTDSIHVIFPEDALNKGIRVAKLCSFLWSNNQKGKANINKRIPIYLYNEHSIPNGYVTVGPFRSSLFTTAPQFDDFGNWMDLLTIHEYQHVKQFANSQTGISGLLKRVLGSWAWGGAVGLSLPRWYLEGDATRAETYFSTAGRGRMPSFLNQYKSLIVENKHYTYEKAAAGSYKDFVPNWYNLGFHMLGYIDNKFGNQVIDDIHDDATKYRGLFFPFSKSMQKHTGFSTKEIYNQVVSFLDSIYDPGLQIRDDNFIKIQEAKKNFTNYTNPIYSDKGDLIAIKGGYGDLPSLVIIDSTGKTKNLTQIGVNPEFPYQKFSYSKEKIIWAELGFHHRREYISFSNIYIFDIETNTKIKLTSEGRFYSPYLDSIGKNIAAVQSNEKGEYRIVTINIESKAIISATIWNDNASYHFPCWTEPGAVYFVKQENNSNSIIKWDMNSGLMEEVLSPIPHKISFLEKNGDKVIFTSSIDGGDNIYSLDLITKHLSQLTKEALGAYFGSFHNENLLFSSSTSTGLKIKSIDLNPITLDHSKIKPVKPFLIEGAGAIKESDLSSYNFMPQKFRKSWKLINFHSLLPVVNAPIGGIRLLSDNSFSTLSSELAGYYNWNENEFSFIGSARFSAYYPEILLSGGHLNRSSNFFNLQIVDENKLISSSYNEEWTENFFSGGISIPVNFSNGLMSNFARLTYRYSFSDIHSKENWKNPNVNKDTLVLNQNGVNQVSPFTKDYLKDTKINHSDLSFSFSIFRRLSYQQFRPSMGLQSSLRWRKTSSSQIISGEEFSYSIKSFLPGLLKNHSLSLGFTGKHSKVLANYKFSNFYNYPRGYSSFNFDRINKFTAEYMFPLAYPDASLGFLAFIKRIKMNLFVDYSHLQNQFPISFDKNLSSLGTEMLFDFRFLRVLEIDAGFRLTYVSDPGYTNNGKRTQFEFILLSISE